MGGFRSVASVSAAGLALCACASPPQMDLGRNENLYRLSGYAARAAAERDVFVAPVVDARGARAEDASGSTSVDYFPDGRWTRPPAVMVDDVLRREISSSGVFHESTAQASPDTCILRAQLTQFDVGSEMHVAGWRSFAGVALKVSVLGPTDAAGERATLFEESFQDVHRSDIDWHPPPAAALMGASLRQVMLRVMSALDQSNLARPAVPADR